MDTHSVRMTAWWNNLRQSGLQIVLYILGAILGSLCSLVLLAACFAIPPGSPTPLPPTDTLTPAVALPTHTLLPTGTLRPTKLLLPTATLLPTITFTPLSTRPPTATFEAGLVVVEHPKLFGWVFLIDPTAWTVETVESADYQETLKFLRHKSLPDCQLKAPMAAGIGTPDRYYRKNVGAYSFLVDDFLNASLYETDNKSLHGSQFFDLYGTTNSDCRAALETVLGSMVEAPVFYGDFTPVPDIPSTPRPPLEFECNSLPPLLRVGDIVSVIADGVWLRSEPRRAEDTQSRLFQQYAPYFIEIDVGPVCAEDYVFWHVTTSLLGEGGGETLTGWMAEANSSEYFLENLYP
jgi:hypothetical protein